MPYDINGDAYDPRGRGPTPRDWWRHLARGEPLPKRETAWDRATRGSREHYETRKRGHHG